MIAAYPLQWPIDYPRTKGRQRARFKNSFAKGRDMIINEVRRLGGRGLVISTNIPLKPDGYPYASSGVKLPDPGVAAYFTYEGAQVVLCCDKWDLIDDNVVAVAKAIEAMRGIDRWGVSDMLKRAFTGFKTLPEARGNNWWEILGVPENATAEEIKSAYRGKANIYHPDKPTGNAERFIQIQAAYQQAEKQFI